MIDFTAYEIPSWLGMLCRLRRGSATRKKHSQVFLFGKQKENFGLQFLHLREKPSRLLSCLIHPKEQRLSEIASNRS